MGFFITPKDVIAGPYKLVAVAFILTLSLTMACVAKGIKEKVKATSKLSSSFFVVVASIIGISALQVCGIGAPACGMSVGVGIVSVLFPGFVFNYLKEYSVLVLILSIFIQMYSLYKMNCLRFA